MSINNLFYAYGLLVLAAHSVSATDSTQTGASQKALTEQAGSHSTMVQEDRGNSEQPDDVIVVKETKDTVYVLDKAAIKNGNGTIKRKVERFSNKGYGFSGGPFYGLAGINIKPVKTLCGKDPYLRNKRFYFSSYHFEPVIMSGGAGLAGIGSGIRIGGGGVHGSKKFTSAPFNGDSVITLEVGVSYGGFIFEKVFKRDKWHIKTGGLIGGGSMKVSVRRSNTVFSDDYLDDDDKKTTAGFFCLNPYGGCSYSFFPIFHVGVDISLPVFLSTEGFSSAAGDFYTVNPGILFKFIFGNLG